MFLLISSGPRGPRGVTGGVRLFWVARVLHAKNKENPKKIRAPGWCCHKNNKKKKKKKRKQNERNTLIS